MIPMRDGVKLYTVLIIPKGARKCADHARPHALLRRQGDRARQLRSAAREHPARRCTPSSSAPATSSPVQDVRGKYKSEGDYVMNRPLRGPLNPTTVDHSTDAYDTIDWLVKNVPEIQRPRRHDRHQLRRLHRADEPGQPAPGAQGRRADQPDGRRVEGRRLVPQRRLPPGDDQLRLRPDREQEVGRGLVHAAATTITTTFLRYGSAGAYGQAMGMEQLPFWLRLTQHPGLRRISGRTRRSTGSSPQQPLTVPTLLVDSLWDQEDIYGAPAVFDAVKAQPPTRTSCSARGTTARPTARRATLGPLDWGSDTGKWFRAERDDPVPRPASEGRPAGRTSRGSPRSRPAPTSGSASPTGRRPACAAARRT